MCGTSFKHPPAPLQWLLLKCDEISDRDAEVKSSKAAAAQSQDSEPATAAASAGQEPDFDSTQARGGRAPAAAPPAPASHQQGGPIRAPPDEDDDLEPEEVEVLGHLIGVVSGQACLVRALLYSAAAFSDQCWGQRPRGR